MTIYNNCNEIHFAKETHQLTSRPAKLQSPTACDTLFSLKKIKSHFNHEFSLTSLPDNIDIIPIFVAIDNTILSLKQSLFAIRTLDRTVTLLVKASNCLMI